MKTPEKEQALEYWIARIRDKDMPIFGQTVQSVLNVAGDESASAAKLASAVLQDVSMTARVLKLVNSPYYNPARTNISTISRAVVVLGFHTIRNICLSITLVDSLVTGSVREKLTHKLARAIHAAVQARSIATAMKDESPEEIFIATLLYRLGEMAFWCFSGKEGQKLAELTDQPGYEEGQSEQEQLGFCFDELTLGLVKEWRLRGLLQETLTHPEQADKRGQSVILAHALARATEEHGWDSPEVKKLQSDAAKLADMAEEKLVKQLHKNAEEAAEIAGFYGAGKASAAIPVPGRERPKKQQKQPKISPWPLPDGTLQLKVLGELSQVVEKKTDFNMIMEMVMEGIYRGIGFDRALLALLTPDHNTLYAKYCLGKQHEYLTDQFRFSHQLDPSNLFFKILELGQPLWATREKSSPFNPFITAAITQAIGFKPFYSAPILINGRAIGLIYVDRSLSGRTLDKESYDSFQHFAKQASMVLSLRLASR